MLVCFLSTVCIADYVPYSFGEYLCRRCDDIDQYDSLILHRNQKKDALAELDACDLNDYAAGNRKLIKKILKSGRAAVMAAGDAESVTTAFNKAKDSINAVKEEEQKIKVTPAVSLSTAAGTSCKTTAGTLTGNGAEYELLMPGEDVVIYKEGQQPEVQTITASNVTKTYGNAAFSLGAKTNGDGTLTYKSSNAKVATVSSAGKVTIKGAGTAKITISASATANYKAASKTITVTVKQATNPLKISAKTATVKYSKLKKKTQTLAVTKVIKFMKKLNDKKTYTLVSAKKGSKSYKKYFKVNKTTGKVTVKKGLKKGTYKVKVKVKALGNTNYKASAVKSVTFTVKVK